MADTVRCCICDKPLEPPYHILGHRAYCDEHFANVNKPHPGFWRASIIQIVGMGIFTAVLAWLGRYFTTMDQTTLVLVGLFLAIVPTALWLVFFYRQDRLEPEPKSKLSLTFALAFLLTDVFGRRLINDWFRVSDWAPTGLWTSLLASILIIGFTYQVITYIAVRAIVYRTEEFDERMDGIVYGTVAGLGVATLLNFRYILDNQGVAIQPGVIHVVTTALAQASFAGLMGYFMAEAKFTHRPVWYVPVGFALAAVFNGFFSWLIREVSATGLSVDPYRSLALGLVVALIAFFALVALMRRSTEVTLRRATTRS